MTLVRIANTSASERSVVSIKSCQFPFSNRVFLFVEQGSGAKPRSRPQPRSPA